VFSENAYLLAKGLESLSVMLCVNKFEENYRELVVMKTMFQGISKIEVQTSQV
jgi:hypothetical protein